MRKEDIERYANMIADIVISAFVGTGKPLSDEEDARKVVKMLSELMLTRLALWPRKEK